MVEWILLAIIILLQVVDTVTTATLLKQGCYEWNPLQKWLMDRLGVLPSLIATKLVFVGGCFLCAWYAELAIYFKVALYLFAIIFVYVCANNISLWKNHKG